MRCELMSDDLRVEVASAEVPQELFVVILSADGSMCVCQEFTGFEDQFLDHVETDVFLFQYGSENLKHVEKTM